MYSSFVVQILCTHAFSFLNPDATKTYHSHDFQFLYKNPFSRDPLAISSQHCTNYPRFGIFMEDIRVERKVIHPVRLLGFNKRRNAQLLSSTVRGPVRWCAHGNANSTRYHVAMSRGLGRNVIFGSEG